MPFIGIISDEKTENCIKKGILKRLEINEESIIFIKENNIDNIRNIKFETIIVTREFGKIDILKKILENSEYLIINSDKENNLSLINSLKLKVVTYGFNSKATITASSVEEDEALICVQRNITNSAGNIIESQEIKMEIEENANCSMAIVAILLIYKSQNLEKLTFYVDKKGKS